MVRFVNDIGEFEVVKLATYSLGDNCLHSNTLLYCFKFFFKVKAVQYI